MAERKIEDFAMRLSDPNLDVKHKVNVATELRDAVEAFTSQGSLYPTFLKKLMPILTKLLDGQPVFISTSWEQKLRNCVLEIIHRLPMTPPEALEPYAPEIVDLLIGLARVENEENAILCMRTIINFQRNQTKVLGERVQPFLDLIQEMFEMMEQAVKDTFDNPAQAATSGIPATPSNPQNFQSPRPGSPTASVSDLGVEQQTTRPLAKGMQSFKVLAECPIIVVSLFQSYRNCVNKNVKLFVPLIKSVLLLQARPQERAHAEARAQGKIFTGVSHDIKNRTAFGDFITAQVKTMSFLAYLLRAYAQQLSDFLPALPEIVVRLLKDCPRERSSARKELLVAIRHIINFNFRKIFLTKIDELLDERVLIGDGLTVYETMRPLAFSMLADLLHHLRESLSRDQICRTVVVYTKNLHDDFPGTSFQTMSAKLLLNMADSIAKLENKQDARHFLIMILDSIAEKFAVMNRQYPNAVKLAKQYANQQEDQVSENYFADKANPPDWDEVEIFNAVPIRTSNPRDRGADPVTDNKFLFKNLVNGLKNVFYQLKACNPQPEPIDPANAPPNWQEVSYGYNAEEVAVITKLFREGAHVFRYYSLEKPQSETQYSSALEYLATHYMVPNGKEEKDLLETFATVFHSIDPAMFHEVFHSEIPKLYDMIFEHTALLHIAQFFLASEATSPSFAGMLLQFLMSRIGDVGSADVKVSSVLLRLFKLSFMAVTLFSTHNEQVLLPHVTKIVTKSIQLSTTAEEPINYFLLLRSLFRSIGGGRFEHLYKEILPLLEMLLEVLNNLLLAARKPQDRDLYVELCLTVPARLSNLLPHLSYLMRPLVVALRAGSDLVGQGLRTLELCVDNLTADYLDPIMAPVIDELMTALWDHLRPMPYSHFHAHTTMRILGKLGGRNRKFLNGPSPLDFKEYADDDCSIDIKLIGTNKERAFPADLGIDVAYGKLLEVPKTAVAKKSDAYYKQQAFKLLSSQLKLYIGSDSLPEDFARLVRLQVDDLLEAKYDIGPDIFAKSERDKSMHKKSAEEQTLKKLLKACLVACTIVETEEAATSLITDVCRHFTILEVGRASAQARHLRKPFDVKSGEGPVYVDSRILADAFVESLSSENAAIRDVTVEAIRTVFDCVVVLFGSVEKVSKLPFFLHLARTFCQSCHEEEWFTKAGGSLGIDVFATKIDLGDAWMADRQVEFVRALMYVIKDVPQDLPASVRVQAQKTLEVLLGRCNKSMSKDDFKSPQSRLYNLCGLLIYELAHLNKHVREAAQKGFTIMAEALNVKVHELMIPVKDRLLQPIYNKPLRALPFAVQIGYIDAISFCLGLQHEIVEFNDQLNRLLMESLALADADDESLATKPNEQRTAESIISLRVSCIRLLSMAMGFAEFGNSPANPSRPRIIAVFFKSLYSKSPEVIDAANAGLKGVLTMTNKLPKDLLQNGLRPILMNLQDPKRLSVAGLDGLARLLTLLTNYFKVEIGSRLLDHMRTIADQNALQKISFTLVEQNPSMKVVAAILNIFHLLPPAAITFMEGLVNKVLELEEKLRRTTYSPFREPLVKYLNRYPKETWSFFSARLHEMKYGRLLAQILEDSASAPLRDYISGEIDGLIGCSFDIQDADRRAYATVNTIHIIHSITICSGAKSLLSHDSLRHRLLMVGKELHDRLRRDTLPAPLRLPVDQSGEQLMSIFAHYLAGAQRNLDLLLEIIEAITSNELKPSHSFFKYIYDHIISSDSLEYWRVIVLRCMDLYADRSVSQRAKAFAFHYLVNPIFATDIKRNWSKEPTPKVSRFLDKAMTEAIHNKLGQPGVDHARMELLQLSAMLIKYHHNLVQDARKDVIKFGWNYIRLDDIINKHAAYTPSKIVVQIYVALLRAHQNEGRSLVTQALELIAPVLPKRVAKGNDPRAPIWAKLPRRILSEEISNLQQLMSIFQFVARHPDLFYEAREHFAPLIVQSLSKIAPPPNPSADSKKLALNLISLIWQWEERRVRGPSSPFPRGPSESPQLKKRKLDGTQVVSSPATSLSAQSGSERAEYVLPAPLRMILIKYLVQLISTLPERYPVPSARARDPLPYALQVSATNDMCKKALRLLHDLLGSEFWGDLDTDLFPKVTEAILTSDKIDKPDEKVLTSIINSLQIVRILVNSKSDEWLVSHVPQLQKLLERSLRSDNPEVQDCLHAAAEETSPERELKPLVRCILDAIPDETPEEDEPDPEATSSGFIAFLSAIATEMLSAGNLVSSINILWTLAHRKPSELDQHIPQVMKALQQLSKDHLAAYNVVPGQNAGPAAARTGEASANNGPDPHEIEIQTNLTLKAIEMTALRMSALGDQRRPFLSVLASLLEKSQSIPLCLKILDMAESWVFRSNETFPTLKEKTAVLHKMLLFESRSDPTLLMKFLNLVIRIYEDQKIKRTELTVRLEHAFLVGTRAQDIEMRNRFMAIFDASLSRTAQARLSYVLTSQNWDTLADSFWIAQASQLILGAVEKGTPASLHADDLKTFPASVLFGPYANDHRKDNIMLDDKFEELIAGSRRFCSELGEIKARDLIEPLSQLQHTDVNLSHRLWVSLFPICWAAMSKDDRLDLKKGIVSLLTKEYHQRQVDKRPNVVQALLEGVARTKPRFSLPPHVMKFLSRTYDAWYTAACSLEEDALNPVIDTPAVRESTLDALVEVYAGLQEDDLFYGLWRRRCQFVETNAGLSYEQNGMWDKAQQLYEAAQIKARIGTIPFSQGEYMLWEDHWVLCAQKLQQWEILSDFAKHENFNDLLLESAWRNLETWTTSENREQLESIIKAVSDAPTPRRVFFQAFMSLLKLHNKSENDFNRICDEAMQLSIRKWHQLPKRITNAHIPILQNFQQLVELHDASVICASLASTTQQNLDTKSQELKLLLGTWRDRLPNVWDDINSWQDLVTWRQHVFQLINGTYLTLLPPQQSSATGNSYAYRGYHETAWIINRFAHVARKHQLPEVCINQLSRIYTLPNIEIQEAFLKLREQAKCHYQNRNELTSGLDVINNTNLNYFGQQQKAEFFTLKGMFLAKLNHKEEANEAFGTALYYDIRLPKAWAEWGHYNDNLFKEEPTNMERAAAAVSCYLEAAGLFKSAKSRKMISRILWLLSLDDAEGKVHQAFENFKGETPVWYWITFIPQLLTSLSHREARISRAILVKIAKIYPQALYFLLRTSREDMLVIKKQQEQRQEKINRAMQAAGQTPKSGPLANKPNLQPNGVPRPPAPATDAAHMAPQAPNGECYGTAWIARPSQPGQGGQPMHPAQAAQAPPNQTDQQGGQQTPAQPAPKKPWELTEEIMAVLKTAFPLLALSMETMVDQIQKHFKCPPDEDAYRLIVALLNDGLSYVGRMPASYAQDVKLPPATEANITRFAETILPAHIRKSFEADFVAKKPTMFEYIQKLRKWRDKFEEKLDRRPSQQSLESFSPHLSEFRFQKFDEVEVPGQYLQHRDKNQDFIRIERFLPNVDLVRGIGVCHRRLKIRGHDGSIHQFAIQHPAARHCRREERILQLFRIFNGVLAKRKESRRRNLTFHLPLMIPLAPHIRMVQDDPSYIPLQGIFEDHCRRHGMNKDEPILFTMEKLRALTDMKSSRYPDHSMNLRMEAYTAIQDKWVPNNLVLEYFQHIYPNFADFWLFRRQFSYQLAALTFMTYIMHMNNRYPHKMFISRATGNIWGAELIPAMAAGKAFFHNPEPVPFRLTPNLQTTMGPIAMEGIFSCAVMAIARCLTEPEFELEQHLSIFVRDEMIFWFTQQHRSGLQENQLRETVQMNSDIIVKKAVSLAQPPVGNLPANQTIIDLVSRATNPMHLAQSDALWMPYL
ncbi:putative histone acetylase complex subunit Paf400 [Xylona heveae TC161]|uniref:Putative histone acetylase complex subunit Paf400 n=1 Tax=Xylona heveae (strain CBS 132557 / TC161) TaxID=1328760 RepID=A0A165AAU4_XYLHT|nr:putative histone acetylase complex subunit Paf400 [Xylona heveae TC161]KZF20186.1 putative histone acetylase complex subunit Paf400 [Xylona heveae TC161]